MRAVKRWCKSRYADLRNADRRKAVAEEISHYLGNPVRLEKSGNRGQDDIYYIYFNGKPDPSHVLRLYNPFKKEKIFDDSCPFIILPYESRIEQEWKAYQTGYSFSLTPNPVWKDRDALVCEYLPYTTMHDILLSCPDRSWELINRAADRLQDLHRAGLIHMDASLANILTDPELDNLVFIDFEFTPAAGLSLRHQQLYDHLRLLESSMKFIPENRLNDSGTWLQKLNIIFGDNPPDTGLDILVPALSRLRNNDRLWNKINTMLYGKSVL